MRAKPGYILVLTLLVLSASILLLSAFVREAFVFQRQARIAKDKAFARQLAFSTLQIALAQVSYVVKEKSEKEKGGPEKSGREQQWLTHLLPVLNRWQMMDLSAELNGTIDLYVASEQGKINLLLFSPPEEKKPEEKSEQNQKDQKSRPEQKEKKPNKLSGLDELIKKEKDISPLQLLVQFKQRFGRTPDDVTDCLRLKEFEKFSDTLFIPDQTELKTKKKKFSYMMDLFTIATPVQTQSLNPWLLTQSVKTLLGLKTDTSPKELEQAAKKMKPEMDWKASWDQIFAPIYGKNYAALNQDVATLFSSKFDANAFSVVSYCTTGSVSIGIYALLERIPSQPKSNTESILFRVAKLYWL